MERLTGRENDKFNDVYVKGHNYIAAAYKLADYEDAEENGLLLRLPCKVGSTVYGVRDDVKQVIECKITNMVICEFDRYFRLFIFDDGRYSNCDLDNIGKTVFFTREEAEQALKGKDEK